MTNKVYGSGQMSKKIVWIFWTASKGNYSLLPGFMQYSSILVLLLINKKCGK